MCVCVCVFLSLSLSLSLSVCVCACGCVSIFRVSFLPDVDQRQSIFSFCHCVVVSHDDPRQTNQATPLTHVLPRRERHRRHVELVQQVHLPPGPRLLLSMRVLAVVLGVGDVAVDGVAGGVAPVLLGEARLERRALRRRPALRHVREKTRRPTLRCRRVNKTNARQYTSPCEKPWLQKGEETNPGRHTGSRHSSCESGASGKIL